MGKLAERISKKGYHLVYVLQITTEYITLYYYTHANISTIRRDDHLVLEKAAIIINHIKSTALPVSC